MTDSRFSLLSPRRFMLLAMAASGFGMAAPRARAEPFSCSIFQEGTRQGKLLFNGKRLERAGVAAGSVEINTTFTSADGAVAVTEEVTTTAGKLTRYAVHQKQTNEEGRLDVDAKAGKVNFSYTKGGNTETATEDLTPDLIIGPTTIEFLHAHWAELLSGGSVNARYAALDRRETVGFKFFKVEEEKRPAGSKPLLLVKMKPSSFVIAAIVKPLIFTFDPSDRRLLQLDGRTLPKQNIDGKWKDLDAEITYRY